MSTVNQNCLSEYVFTLPFEIRKQICNVLDQNDNWEALAALMPDISSIDVEYCRQISVAQSPAETLLTIWGAKGNKVTQLYNLLGRIGMVRSMSVLRDRVDPKYHHWEKECQQRNQDMQFDRSCCVAHGLSKSQPASSVSSFHTSSLIPSSSCKCPQSSCNVISESSVVQELESIRSGLQNTPTVKYEELVAATNDFSHENTLGEGGYGIVYKGQWKHTEVAVKRVLNKRNDGTKTFENERLLQSLQELRALAKYRHDNILPLYGFSFDGPEPCLVYQYMANGSLEDRILCRNGTASLTWIQRMNISQGIARGLHFLHAIASVPVIHGDVKSPNILLDKHMEPKLGDFGLCRDGQIETGKPGNAPLIASRIKGTLAYLPPEFIMSKILSTKLDVYSYGVVLLELDTGLRAYVDSREPPALNEYVRNVHIQCGEISERTGDVLADRRCLPTSRTDWDIFHRLFQEGLLCSENDRETRPSFGDILTHLAL